MAPSRRRRIIIDNDVRLREVTNPWRSSRYRRQNAAENEDEKTERLYEKVRSILNKLTSKNLQVLLQQFHSLEIDTQEKLQGVVDLFYEKAIEEPIFSETYALFCTQVRVDDKVQNSNEKAEDVSFSKLVINRCQLAFENLDSVENDVTKELEKELNECKNDKKKQELLIELETKKWRKRKSLIHNMKFIGEFAKLGSLTTENVTTLIVNHLFDHPNELKLECICVLLTTIGMTYEIQHKQVLDEYFEKVTKFMTENDGSLRKRIRFLFMDLVELRERNWVPRLSSVELKTALEIEDELRRISMKEIRKAKRERKSKLILDNQKLLGVFRKTEQDMLVMSNTGENIKSNIHELEICLKKIQKIMNVHGLNQNMRFVLIDAVPETSNVIELDSLLSYYPSSSLRNQVHFDCKVIYQRMIRYFQKTCSSHLMMKRISIWILGQVGHEVQTPIFVQILMLAIFETYSVMSSESQTKIMENSYAKMLDCFQKFVNKDTDSQKRCEKSVQDHVLTLDPKSLQDLFCQLYYNLQEGFSWEEVANILNDSVKSVASYPIV